MIFSSFVVCRLECCSCLACFLSSYAVRSETESQRDLAHVTIKVSLWVVVPGLANTSSTPPRAPPSQGHIHDALNLMPWDDNVPPLLPWIFLFRFSLFVFGRAQHFDIHDGNEGCCILVQISHVRIFDTCGRTWTGHEQRRRPCHCVVGGGVVGRQGCRDLLRKSLPAAIDNVGCVQLCTEPTHGCRHQ